jgi:hypothetical protein
MARQHDGRSDRCGCVGPLTAQNYPLYDADTIRPAVHESASRPPSCALVCQQTASEVQEADRTSSSLRYITLRLPLDTLEVA